MTTASNTLITRRRYSPEAYQFVSLALQFTQRNHGRVAAHDPDYEEAHITGHELLDGIRELALQQFGLLAATVFRQWGVRCTDDFGRIVFELIERGEMKKTEHDQLSDFSDVYDFEEVFDRSYQIDTSTAFRRR